MGPLKHLAIVSGTEDSAKLLVIAQDKGLYAGTALITYDPRLNEGWGGVATVLADYGWAAQEAWKPVYDYRLGEPEPRVIQLQAPVGPVA